MTKPTPAVPELIWPSSPPVSASKRAVRWRRMSLSQNQCGPGRSGSVITWPTVSAASATPLATTSHTASAPSTGHGDFIVPWEAGAV